MWILRTEGDPVPGAEATAFFLAAGSLSVGRQTGKGIDIELANDPSISRRHAELIASTLDVHSPFSSLPSLQLNDFSRFGTAVNGAVIGSGNSASVSPGDVIQFGHKTKLRVSWDQVVLCMPEAEAAAQQAAAALGFHCQPAWDNTCTHLVVGQALGLSAAAACAAAAGKPIVHKQWLDACVKASKNAVKQLPPPVDAFLLSVAYPPGIAGQVPPADAQHAAASAVHAPLQEWTVVWHPGTQDPQLQQAAALAGGSNAAANDPSLAAAVAGRLLHVVPDSGAAGAAAPHDQPSITPECLMAAIVDGRAATLQALWQKHKLEPAPAQPAGQQMRPPPPKKRAGAALAGRGDKKPRRGRASSPQDDAIEAEFDVAKAEPPPRGDADAEPAPMDTEQTVVVASIITTPPQPLPPAAPAGNAATPNFKRFKKSYAVDDRRPLIPFAAASYAQDVGAQDFLKAEKQTRQQNKAADDLFVAKIKAGKAGGKAGRK